MPNPFSPDQFARQLLTEALFYDEEYGALGNISLVDPDSVREQYLASFDPKRDAFLIESAVEWEPLDADKDGEVDYALAVDGEEHGTYSTPGEAADVLLQLARENDLAPAFMVLFEEEG